MILTNSLNVFQMYVSEFRAHISQFNDLQSDLSSCSQEYLLADNEHMFNDDKLMRTSIVCFADAEQRIDILKIAFVKTYDLSHFEQALLYHLSFSREASERHSRNSVIMLWLMHHHKVLKISGVSE